MKNIKPIHAQRHVDEKTGRDTLSYAYFKAAFVRLSVAFKSVSQRQFCSFYTKISLK